MLTTDGMARPRVDSCGEGGMSRGSDVTGFASWVRSQRKKRDVERRSLEDSPFPGGPGNELKANIRTEARTASEGTRCGKSLAGASG